MPTVAGNFYCNLCMFALISTYLSTVGYDIKAFTSDQFVQHRVNKANPVTNIPTVEIFKISWHNKRDNKIVKYRKIIVKRSLILYYFRIPAIILQ